MMCSPSLLRPQYERPINIRMTERSTQIVDSDILASQNRYLYCFLCGKQLNSKAGKTLHDKMHEREMAKRNRLSRPPKRRVYTCKECNEQFSKKRYLNDHTKSNHLKLFECPSCHKTFKDRLAFDMHDTLDSSNLDSLDAPPAYCTRSHSRMSCHVSRSRPASCDAGFYSLRPNSPETDIELELESSRVARTHQPERRKAKSVETWVRTSRYHSSISERSISPTSSLWSSQYARPTQYLCSHPSCLKTFPSLNWATAHEMADHKMLALFRCKECRKRFTTSENLKRHRIDNHPNVVICVLCGHAQDGIAAIEEHFQMHRQSSVKCEICGKLFVSEFYLEEHLKRKTREHRNVAPQKGEILMRYTKRETQVETIIDDAFNKNSDIGIIDYSTNLQSGMSDTESVDFVPDLPWRT